MGYELSYRIIPNADMVVLADCASACSCCRVSSEKAISPLTTAGSVRCPATDSSPEPMANRSYTMSPHPLCRAYPEERGRPTRAGLPRFWLAHQWPERGSTGWQLRHEGVTGTVEGSVEGVGGGGVLN